MSAKRAAGDRDGHAWEFKPRFRRHAFGWKSQPAIQRIKQAVSEIKKVARREPALAAEGAVLFFERVSPAIEQVDGSSGAIGTAVGHAIEDLVPVIAAAPADQATRASWLERLWRAYEDDEVPYLEQLAQHWGELCASPEVASAWADRLLTPTRMALTADAYPSNYFHGATACLSSLFRAARHEEILHLLQTARFWSNQRWAVKALAAMGRHDEAIARAESCRGPYTSDVDVDAMCEEILLSAGRVDEAYARYGLRASSSGGGGTYLAAFKAVAKKYPDKRPQEILADLVATTPGEEGKWFTAAKDLELYDAAVALARISPCNPKTLARAARDHAPSEPAFALEVGCAALEWLCRGFGYDITGADVYMAYGAAMQAAQTLGRAAETKERIREMASRTPSFVSDVLGRELGLGRT